MDYSPKELEILKSLNLLDTTQQNTSNQPAIDPALQAEYEQAQKGQTESTLGILGNRLSTAFGDTIPIGLATATKQLLPGETPNIDQYIAKQKQEQAFSEAQLTPESQQSTTRKVADIGSNFVAGLAPLATGIIAAPATGGVSIPVGIAATTAINAGQTADEFADRRRQELINTGMSPQDIEKKISDEQQSVFWKSAGVEALSNVASVGIGGALGQGAKTFGKGFVKSAVVDAPLGAVGGAVDEAIIGGQLQAGANPELMKEKALMGGAIGGVSSGLMGGITAKREVSQANEAINKARVSNVAETVVSMPLNEKSANERMKFLSELNTDANVKFELRDALDANGNIINNRKQVVGVKEIQEPVVKAEEQVQQPVLEQPLLEQAQPTIKQEEPSTYSNEVRTKQKFEDIQDINTVEPTTVRSIGELDIANTPLEKRVIREKNPETGKYEVQSISVPKDRDNNGFGLTLEQTLKDKETLDNTGKKGIIDVFPTEKLDLTRLSDDNKNKSILINAETNKSANQNVVSAPNINIKDRSQAGNYKFNTRAIVLDNGQSAKSVEFLTSVNISNSEPFLKGARDIKDGQTVTLARERTSKFPENLSVYVDGVKVGKVDYNVSKEFSKFLDANAVDKISAKIVSIEMPYSKKDKRSDQTRQVFENGTVGRTNLMVLADLNDNANNLTYTIKDKKGNKLEVPIFDKEKIADNVIDGVNLKQQAEPVVKQDMVEPTVKQQEEVVAKQAQEQETMVKPVEEMVNETTTPKERVRTVDEIVKDVNIDQKTKLAELDKAIYNIEKTLNRMHGQNKNNSVRLFVDYANSKNTYNKIAQQKIAELKKIAGDAPGIMKPENGTNYVYINIDNIKNTALKSDISAEDLAKFVYTHEALGHGTLSSFFKTEKELNTYLDDMVTNAGDGVKELMSRKAKLYEKDGLDKQVLDRMLVEEVISDLANNKVSYPDPNNSSKMVVKSIHEFSKEFATGQFKDDKFKSIVTDFLKFVGRAINKLIGNDVFKVYEDTKTELTNINQQIKEFQKALETNSPYIKEKFDFIAKSDHETVKFYNALANDPAFIDSDLHKLNVQEKVSDFFGSLGNKVPWLGTMWGYAQKNPVFKKGFEYAMRIKETGNTVDNAVNQILKDVYGDKFGWKTGVNKKDIDVLNKAFFETEINNKLFTEDELRSRFGLEDKSILAYQRTIEALKLSSELNYKSELFKEAVKLGLKDEASYDKYRHLTEMDYDTYVNSLTKDLEASGVNIETLSSFKNEVMKKDLLLNNTLTFNIPPTGKFYLKVTDSNGNVVKFDQFNSSFQANSAKKRILATNKDKQLNFEIDKTPTKIKDLENNEHPFNVAWKSYKNYSMTNYKNDPTGIAPFNYYRSLFTNLDNTSKNTSLNIHLPIMNRYIEELKNNFDNKTASDLEKVRDTELAVDSTVATKLRGFNSIWNLGGSVASAISNAMSIPMIVAPYLSRYEGGGAYLAKAMTMAKDSKVWSEKISIDDLVNHLVNKEIDLKNVDIETAKTDIRRLLEAGILKEVGDYDTIKVKDGIDLTSNYNNVKNVAVKSFMTPFAKSEQLNRMITGIASLNTAYKNKLNGFDFAKETIYSTQGYYGKVGRPIWARSGLGQLLYQFKTYPMNFTELMLRFAFNGDKKDKMAMLQMGSLLVLLGGLKSIPLSSDVGDIVDTARRISGDETANTGKEIEDTMKNLLGNTGTGLLMYGLASEFGLPFNLQQRISFNNMIPGTDLLDPANKDKAKSLKEIGGPTVSNASNMIDAIKAFSAGDYYQSVYNASPSSLRSTSQGLTALATGEFRDKKGLKVADATTGEALTRIIGFQPANLAETYRSIERINLENQNLKYFKGLVYDLYAEAIFEKNPNKRAVAKTMVEKYKQDNPTKKIEINEQAIKLRVKSMKQTLAERYKTNLSKEVRGEYDSMFKD